MYKHIDYITITGSFGKNSLHPTCEAWVYNSLDPNGVRLLKGIASVEDLQTIPKEKTIALWDTGSTINAVDIKLVDKLSIAPEGKEVSLAVASNSDLRAKTFPLGIMMIGIDGSICNFVTRAAAVDLDAQTSKVILGMEQIRKGELVISRDKFYWRMPY